MKAHDDFLHAIYSSIKLGGICLSFVLAGCGASPIQSHRPGSEDNKNVGMVYALPKGQIQLIASRKKVTDDDVAAAKKNLADVTAALTADKKALADAKDAHALAAGASDRAGPLAKDEMAKNAAMAKAIVDFLTVKVGAEMKSAKTAEQKVQELAGKEGKWIESASVTQLASVPDANHRFVAYLNHDFTRDDKMKISVNGGLLSTTSATTTDQSTSIILNLVQAAAAFSGSNWGLKIASRNFSLTPPAPAATCKAYSFSTVFDPSNIVETTTALKALRDETDTLQIDVDGVTGKKNEEPSNQPISINAPKNPNGLVYRAPRAIRINIGAALSKSNAACTSDGQVDAASYVAIVPDSTAEFILASQAGPFTKTSFDFAFKDGMPTDFGLEQPSELAGIASLPLDIAKAIISVPASLIKLRVDYNSQANAEVAAKTANLQAQLDQLKAQQALDAEKKKAANEEN